LIQEAGEGQLHNGRKILEGTKRLVYPMNWAELDKAGEEEALTELDGTFNNHLPQS